MTEPPIARSAGVVCLQCGYDLTGTTIGATCPECGAPVTPAFQSTMRPTSGKAIAAMVLGICSIPGCMLYGIPAIVCGILAIVFYKQAKRRIAAGEFSPGSMSMAKAGLICGIVGLALGTAYIVTVVVVIIVASLNA